MSESTRHAVVSGSSGFIGRELVCALESEHYSVTNIDLTENFDITDMSSLGTCFEKFEAGDIDAVFHLAAKMFIPHAWEKPTETYAANLTGTLNMLDYCRILDINKFIFASSYIYGQPEYLPIDEEHPIKPSNPYAHSKYLAEELCRSYHEDYGLKCIILRPFNIYGPGQSKNFLIPTIINQLGTGTVKLQDPKPRRDYLYLSDMIEAYSKAAGFDGGGFEIFNIGSGKSYCVQEIVDIILKNIKIEVNVEYTGEVRQNEIPDTVANITRAREALGWEPMVTIEDGIKKVLEASSIQ